MIPFGRQWFYADDAVESGGGHAGEHPSRNNRPELHRGRWAGRVSFRRVLYSLARTDRKSGTPAQFTSSDDTSGPIDSVHAEKTRSEGALIFS